MEPTEPSRPIAQLCTATARSGNRCRRYAVDGATVCPNHGGKAPQVIAKAAQRQNLGDLVGAARVRRTSPQGLLSRCVVLSDALLDAAVATGRPDALADALDRAVRVLRVALPGTESPITEERLDREILALREQLRDSDGNLPEGLEGL